MRKIVLFIALILIVMSFASAQETLKEASAGFSTKEKPELGSIRLIPSQGILIGSDSVLIGKTGIADLLTLADTYSIKYKLTVDSPKQLVMKSIGSPPPGYTGEYQHQPDKYFTDYSATLEFDGLTFCFYYSSRGPVALTKDMYTDSLKINSIVISKQINARLFDDLKIGDSYAQIFNHFDKPAYFNQAGIVRKEIKYTGIVFTIETDKSKVENYGRIIKIEINHLMVD